MNAAFLKWSTVIILGGLGLILLQLAAQIWLAWLGKPFNFFYIGLPVLFIGAALLAMILIFNRRAA